MQLADEESYEVMIRALTNFMSQVSTHCQIMSDAGQDCIDNTEGDPAATRAAEKLEVCIGKIRGTFDQIESIISALQRELEAIREAAAASSGMGDI